MASIYYLCNDASNIKQEISNRYLQQSESKRKQHYAAIQIQRIWKGWATRQQIKMWHQMAIVIQKWYRGWIVRWHLPGILAKYYYDLSKQFYNNQALKIQAFWRGYRVRKYLSFKERRKNRENIQRVTNYIQGLLSAEFEKNKNYKHSKEYESDCLKKVLSSLFDAHHLLRTYELEGAFSINGSKELSPVEKALKEMKFKKYLDNKRKLEKKCPATNNFCS